MQDLEYIKNLPATVIHTRRGESIIRPDPVAFRLKRYILLSGSQKLLFPFRKEKIDKETGEILQKSEFRVSSCHRFSTDDISVYQNGNSFGYSGLNRCGNVWGCPMCCAKVMRLRGEQMSQIFDLVSSNGGLAFLVTFTAAHSIDQKLSFLLDAFKNAKRAMTQSKQYRFLVEERIGSVSATEITYGQKSGWHPHQHDAWFFNKKNLNAEQIRCELFPIWQKACKKFGLETLDSFRGHKVGVDVTSSINASDYLTKFGRERDWSLAAEMTAGRLKTAQGKSKTAWGLLEQAIIDGPDSFFSARWIEYLRATARKSCVSLKGAKDLCQQLGININLDDFTDANKKGESEIVGIVSPFQFEAAVRNGGLGLLLEKYRNLSLKAA